MNKLVLSLVTFLISSNVFATTVRVPLFVQNDATEKIYTMDQINPLLIAKGEKPFPLYVEFTETSVQKFDYKAYGNLFQRIDEALQRAGLTDYHQQSEYVPAEHNNTARIKTCYIGDGTKVLGIVTSLGDTFYSDQYSWHGWKFKNQTHFQDDSNETQDFLKEGSQTWANWNVKSDSVLILASIGDGGDDIQESVIPVCK